MPEQPAKLLLPDHEDGAIRWTKNRPPEGLKVPAENDVSIAEDWAEMLELAEARRAGISRAEARPIVARKIGVPEGKLYSLSRHRLKDISHGQFKKLGLGIIQDLQGDLARVEHELHIATQIGTRLDSGEVFELEARRQKIREALELGPKE